MAIKKKDQDAASKRTEGRDPQLLKRMYEIMVLARAIEDRMVSMYRSGVE